MSGNHKMTMVLLMVIVMVMMFAGCRRNLGEPPVQDPGTDPSQDAVQEVVDDPANEAEVHYYVLYLKHKDQAYIFSNTYSIKTNDPQLADKSLAEFVVEALIRQTGVGELINPIPSETKLLSLEQDGKRVTVNLSQEFADGLTGSLEDTGATIAMVVNSLITLPSIDQVTLLIDGNAPGTINGLVIKEFYGFITEYYPGK